MASFGRTSMRRLEGVHPALVLWALRVVDIMDCSVIYGLRTRAEQRVLVDKGASKTMRSMHLVQSTGYGHAIDLAPYPIDWAGLNRFYILGGVGLAVAKDMGLPIIWGRDWDGDMEFDDQDFNDFLHWELPARYPANLRQT